MLPIASLRTDHRIGAALRCAGSVVVLSLLVLAVAGACGGGEKSNVSTASTPTAAAATREGPATITVKSNPIVGQQGKMLLVSASATAGGQVANACIRITSDRFTVPATVMTAAVAGSSDPCSGPATPATVAAGSYRIAAGIYAPPGRTPEKEFTASVDSTGKAPVELMIDGAALSR